MTQHARLHAASCSDSRSSLVGFTDARLLDKKRASERKVCMDFIISSKVGASRIVCLKFEGEVTASNSYIFECPGLGESRFYSAAPWFHLSEYQKPF